MSTLIQHTNFISAPKPQKNPLLKFSQKPTNLQSSLFSLTNRLVFSTPNTPLDEAYASVLDHCAARNSPSLGRQIHAHIVKGNNARDLAFLSTKLVFMYGKCRSLLEAQELFDQMPDRTVFTYNAMIGAYVSNGAPRRAIELYADMRFLDIPADSHTCSCVLKACSGTEDICVGKEIHGYAVKSGFVSNGIVLNSLVGVYARCKDVNAVELLFGMTAKEDVVSWNLMISAYAENGMSNEAWKLFVEMHCSGVSPSTYTFVAALQACEELSSGTQIHAVALKSSLCFDRYVGNNLVVMYSRFDAIDEAARVFLDIDDRDNVSWNSMLAAYVDNGLYDKSLDFFREITRSGQQTDHVSVISILSACGRSGSLLNGMEVHAFALKNGMESDLQVGNTIMDMYAKCYKMSYMDNVFQRIIRKDYISWTTVVAACVQNHQYLKALESLREVVAEGIHIDTVMVESALLASRGLKHILLVKEIHGYIVRRELSDIVMQNTIVDAYGQCGEVDYAENSFKLTKIKNIVSWTIMIACYVRNRFPNEALELALHMVKSGVDLDSIALLSVLSAAASLSALGKGKEIHGYLVRRYLDSWESIPSSLVDMYASCGSLHDSYKVFTCIGDDKDLVLWTTMINAYGMHGQGMTAIKLFKEMEAENITPDHVSFLALLYACSHSSLVDEGKYFFNSMQCEYNLEPWPEHYACMVDLLGRANCLQEAYELVKSMRVDPTPPVWSAILSACRTHSNAEIGEIAAKRLLEIDPENPGNYVLASNVYALGGRWEEVERVRREMKAMGLKKDPGCSWIEVKNEVHTFITRDKSHPRCDEIYEKLGEMTEKVVRDGGYKPDTSCVLRGDVEEREKVEMVYGHSERLAMAYGLLSSGEGIPVRVTKNLRVCGDCHTFTKLVSKVFDREIVVRDANRFHHFRDGCCSCGDFW